MYNLLGHTRTLITSQKSQVTHKFHYSVIRKRKNVIFDLELGLVQIINFWKGETGSKKTGKVRPYKFFNKVYKAREVVINDNNGILALGLLSV